MLNQATTWRCNRGTSRVTSLISELLRFFSPELAKETALGHFVKKSPVNEVFGLHLLGPRIDLRDVIHHRLKRPQA